MPCRRAVLIIVGLFSATPLLAQQSPCVVRAVTVSITKRDLTAPPQLMAENLKGSFGGKEITIRSVKVPDGLPRVILLVDTSGSMQRRGIAEAEVAEALLSKLPAEVEVGLALFNDDATPVAYPGKSRVMVMSALEALRTRQYEAKGRTALWSALISSVKMFGTTRPGDSIYLISDGGDNRSKIQEREMEEAMGTSGIRLFAIFVGGPIGLRSRTEEELNGPEKLYYAARATGGTLISDADSSGLSDDGIDLVNKSGKPTTLGLEIVQQIQQLLSIYVVDFSLPRAVDKPHEWKLELAGLGKLDADKLDLLYPKSLYPCR